MIECTALLLVIAILAVSLLITGATALRRK